MIRYFARHPVAANVLMAAILIVGIVALPKLQRDTFPVIPATEVEVRVNYPGATAEQVEGSVCQRVEEALDTVMNMDEVRCDARENVAIVTAAMREGADMNEFFNDVKSQVESIAALPAEAKTPTVTKLERTAVVASVALTGPMDAHALKAYADKVKDRIKRDPRIAQVRVLGFSQRVISVELPAAALERYGISIDDVVAAIERQSLDMPAGVMETAAGDKIVRFEGERTTPQAFRDLVLVSGKTGGRILLGEVATIRLGFDAPDEKVVFNGERAALLEVSKTIDQDSLRVMEALQENLKREQGLAPPGVQLRISQDVTENVKDRLRLLIENGVMGLVLVFLAMWAFFNLRFSFWVAMGLPVSFLGAIFVMHQLGYTINMITMVALIVAIGLLMDDAIVISENIAAKARKGLKSVDAVVEGVMQVAPGVTASFITTILVVGPLALMAGKMGAVLKYLPAVLIITLTVSLIEAFLILPAHLRHAVDKLGEGEKRSRIHQAVEARFLWLRDRVFGPGVDKALHRPYLTLGVLLGLALLSFATFQAGLLKYRAFPELESNQIQARILLPQGATADMTDDVVAQVTEALKKVDDDFSARQKGDKRLVLNSSIQYGTNVDAYESGSHLATVTADLLRAEARVGTIDEMLNMWRDLVGAVPGAIAVTFTDRERGVAGKAIDMRLQGNNMEQLKKASLALQDWLATFDGVLDLSDDLRPGKPEYRVTLKETAGTFGVTARAVADTVRAAVQGSTNLEVPVGTETFDVVVRLKEDDRNSLTDLRLLKVTAADGSKVPLYAVAAIEETRGYARVHRVNGLRTVTVQGKLDTARINARDLMAITKKQFMPKLKEQFPGIRVASKGQDAETATTGNSLSVNLAIGLIGIYLVLTLLFKSWIQPLAVLLSVPMAAVGVVWGHLLTGYELSMPSLVGLATLAGIVVNDNILLVGAIKERIAEGQSVMDAGKGAARDRFRAIMLTTLTTIAGLLPLLLETSTQAQFLIPMVVSLTFGLFAATVFALFLVPSMFAVFADFGMFKGGAETKA